MERKNVTELTQAAMIAAIYVVLTVVFAPFGFGEVQIRVSEMLTVLPLFTPAAVPGLFIGCFIGNLLGGAVIADVLGGSIATLLGALLTRKLRKQARWIALLPPVAANICIVPLVLRYAYGVALPIPLMMATVGVGELVSCEVLGGILASVLEKYRFQIWKRN